MMDADMMRWNTIAGALKYPQHNGDAERDAAAEFVKVYARVAELLAENETMRAMARRIADFDRRSIPRRGD